VSASAAGPTGERLGLVLTGGGARAAYQAGALRAIAEVFGPGPLPFRVLAGTSAGAINVAFLAARADDFRAGARRLHELWAGLTPADVYRADPLALGRTGARLVAQLGSGGLFGGGGGGATSLLDSEPLRRLLGSCIDFGAIERALARGTLHGVAVSATNYRSGTAISFYAGDESIEPWSRTSRLGRRARLTLDHVLASAAIPVFFRPVQVEGSDYGDGCIRLTAPLSPAVHLGADRILAIGIRYYRPERETVLLNRPRPPGPISLADVGGVLLNAVFLDSLESDLERLDRINRTLALIPPERGGELTSGLRPIPCLAFRPSADLGNLASHRFHDLPAALRYLLRGIGASDERGWDLMSYLAFDPHYTLPLLDLGYGDAIGRRAEIERFLGRTA